FEPLGPTLRARVAALNVPQGRASAARLMILADAAADQRLGETALVALWLTAEAGPAGLSPGERAQVVRALRRAGFERDARAFALEGLLALAISARPPPKTSRPTSRRSAREGSRPPPPHGAARPCVSSTASCWAKAGGTTIPPAGSTRRRRAGRFRKCFRAR